MQQQLLKVNEIFYSVQGEGRHTGMPAIFLRLAGCSMGCSFCDTKYAFSQGTDMSVRSIIEQFKLYPSKTVILTGGEPTEQNITPLLSALKTAGYSIHLETNGANDIDTHLFDFVCVSPKKYVNESMLKKADIIKLVVSQSSDLTDIKRYYTYENEKTVIYLQPESNLQENIELCLSLIKKHPSARLSVQLHKLLNIR